jgi:GNAT superfamily N-acetyltransferase
VIIRAITPADVPAIHDFIVQLATFEREPHMVKMTLEELHEALFGAVPRAQAIIVDSDEGEIGFAIFSESFNTWTGKPTLHVEDVFVNESARGLGAGHLIFQYLAALTVSRGYHRMEWSVLNWNRPAIRFYESIGATSMAEWTKYRLSGDALHALAEKGI